ncbi:response regulator [Vibrio sinensis]|uniref:response regulator n=1 Tax=Vibrio sinensis TaxID=2302434 RepID=UPI001402762B|nr:response regulator [Vibrio sinensis]
MSLYINCWMHTEHSESQRMILIIDDSPMYRTAAKGMLLKLGYSANAIDFAQDAREALIKCSNTQYSMVFFDYNLGMKANGFQLIDELDTRGLLGPDCIKIIVTGDSTPEVVRGFMELQPDGYLLKPLNYATLRQRLPQFSSKKRALKETLKLMGDHQYEAAIKSIDEAFFRSEDIIVRSQILKAQCLIATEQLDEARLILNNLKDSGEKSTVFLMLAQIEYQQRNFTQALKFASAVKTDPFKAAQATECCGDIYAAQHQYSKAIQEIEIALKISPKVISRHHKQIDYCIASFELESALAACKGLISEVKHSFRDTPTPYMLAAALTTDLAQFSLEETRESYLMSISKSVEHWRRKFTRDEYKGIELLLFCRIHHLKNDFHKSREYFKEYLMLCQENSEREIDLYESIEFAKAAFCTHDIVRYKQANAQVVQRLRNETDTLAAYARYNYFKQFRNKIETTYSHTKRVKEKAKAYFDEKEYQKAAQLVSKAVANNVFDSQICLITLQVLTQAWPHGWNSTQVLRLALFCKEQLRNTRYIQSKIYVSACNNLAQQLQHSDLQITETMAVN